MYQDGHDSLLRGYRLINVVGASLLITFGAMLAFAAGYMAGATPWPATPLGLGWLDLLVFAVAALLPPGARWAAGFIVTRAGRRARASSLSAALQVVAWLGIGIWASCQAPVVIGFFLALSRQRALYLLPFYAVAAAEAFLVVPQFRTWQYWIGVLEHPGKKTRIRPV